MLFAARRCHHFIVQIARAALCGLQRRHIFIKDQIRQALHHRGWQLGHNLLAEILAEVDQEVIRTAGNHLE